MNKNSHFFVVDTKQKLTNLQVSISLSMLLEETLNQKILVLLTISLLIIITINKQK
jgi:hypothetical protein